MACAWTLGPWCLDSGYIQHVLVFSPTLNPSVVEVGGGNQVQVRGNIAQVQEWV